MALALLSAGFQSLPLLPTSKVGPFGADSQVGGLVYILGPCGSRQRTLLCSWEFLLLPQPLRVFFIQRLEALFPDTVTLGCTVCLAHQLFLLVYLHMNVGLPSLLAATLPTLVCQLPFHPLHRPPPCPILQLPPCLESSLPQLPVSAPSTGLDESFSFNSLVLRLPCSLIFWQFWLIFVFKFVVYLLLVV